MLWILIDSSGSLEVHFYSGEAIIKLGPHVAVIASSTTTVCHRQFLPYVNTLTMANCGSQRTMKNVEPCSILLAISILAGTRNIM